MSTTSVFSPLFRLNNENKVGVKIEDFESYREHIHENDSKSVEPITSSYKETVDETYPRTYSEYKNLKGFTSYPNEHTTTDSTTVLKLENFGFEYNKEFFVDFWNRVGSYCEEFMFYHASANHFPSSFDLVHQNNSLKYIYKITVEGENISIEELTFEEYVNRVVFQND